MKNPNPSDPGISSNGNGNDYPDEKAQMGGKCPTISLPSIIDCLSRDLYETNVPNSKIQVSKRIFHLFRILSLLSFHIPCTYQPPFSINFSIQSYQDCGNCHVSYNNRRSMDYQRN